MICLCKGEIQGVSAIHTPGGCQEWPKAVAQPLEPVVAFLAKPYTDWMTEHELLVRAYARAYASDLRYSSPESIKAKIAALDAVMDHARQIIRKTA